ncbi:MAG: YjdF family protein [Anaerofustis sp.]
MNEGFGKLTVFFEDPFWVGIIEETQPHSTRAAKIVFGAEPTDAQLYEYLLCRWGSWQFSKSIPVDARKQSVKNPKRLRRIASKELRLAYVGTKAQQAVQLQQQECARTRKSDSRRRRAEAEQLQYRLRCEKKKQKHRGR